MVDLTFQQQSVLWGQAYEVLVKRGVLACLIEQGLVAADRPGLQPWRQEKLLEVSKCLTRELGLLDERERDIIKAGVQHMALTAFGVGYTAMRAYLQSVRSKTRNAAAWKVRALWCPLLLPGGSTATEEARSSNRTAFYEELGLTGIVDPDWSRKGQPANADFLLWLTDEGKEDCLLVQEYSFDMSPNQGDFRTQGAHLDELLRHRRIVDSRSVFARVAAEVDGEKFELAEDIKTYLSALTSDNKPLYKLCQASSYAEATVLLLQRLKVLTKPCRVRALAVTPNGLESLGARFVPSGNADARCKLMSQLGAAYRDARKIADGDEAALLAQVESVFQGLIKKLPAPLRKGMKTLREMPRPGQDYLFEFSEQVPEFANPAQKYTLDQALGFVENTDALATYFGRPAKEAIGETMSDIAAGDDSLTLRNMHAAAVVAGLRCAKPGRLNVLALEGNPGIGKTTAIRKHLGSSEDRYLFLYVSPRVVINRDVTESMARTDDNKPTGILTVTTNAPLIAAAERWHKKQVEAGLDSDRRIAGAVVADGVAELKKPVGPMLVLSPAQEQEIDSEYAASRLRKDTLSEHEDLVKERQLTGVLAGMASTARELLDLNPQVDRIVLTAALQGFRERENQKTTIDALSKLFVSSAATAAGRDERRQFAKRMPTIVVMVDELAGDGAGARFVHTVASWLVNEFIDCFEDEPSPFTVVLVVSDASLGNEVVLDRYLNAGERTPDKVLVSHSAGKTPFRVAATKVKIGLGSAKRETLHVMTNSFPASELHLRYRVKLSSVNIEDSQKRPGQLETPREAIRRIADEAVMAGARLEVLKALDAGAKQVIYFAQDKLFLRDLKKVLSAEDDLNSKNVQVLDSSVPGWMRKKLVEPETRDNVRVFLMTSSGARGVSFPLTDWIIASVPRFNIESALMEIAQLVYRGRGHYVDEYGSFRSGDSVPRHLVMLVDDYVVSEEGLDQRQWLRQSIDLMTLLVMLRSTILTRITGDSDLRQPLALVPVGAVGVEELVSLMSQYVSQFVKEAEVFKGSSKDRDKDDDLMSTVARAKANVEEIFSKTRLNGVSKRGEDGRTVVKDDFVKQLLDVAASPISPLLCYSPEGTSLPDHAHFSGPVVVETWKGFEKQEVFSFEGHETEVTRASRQLIAQLYEIDKRKECPPSLRNPASSLLRLLQRDQHEAANEFRTLKELKSPNTWIAVPAGRHQFMYSREETGGRAFSLADEPLWQEALGRTLNAGAAVMPPLPRYESFPWAAGVGEVSPLKLDLVFDDRYFMASNELNLLNTLLMARPEVDS